MKKSLVIILAVLFTASLVCVPVFADDGYYSARLYFPQAEANYFGFAKYEDSFNTHSWQDYRRPAAVVDGSTDVQYALGIPETYNGAYYGGLVLGVSTLGVTDGQYLSTAQYWVDPFEISWHFGQLANERPTIDRWRLSLRLMTPDGLTTCVGYTEWWEEGYLPEQYTLSIDTTFIPVFNDVTGSALALCWDYHCDVTDPAGGFDNTQTVRFYVKDKAVTFNYSTSRNPDIPIYKPPANQDAITENQELENELIEGVEGLDLEDNSSTLFDSIGTSIASFSDGLNFVRITLNLFIEDIPWVRDFVQVSLALGITATLLGLAGSIIGGATRRKGGKY